MHAFAAAPHEHVVRPALISTLFPHLPHRHAHIFREAFGGGLLIVLLLAAIGLYTSALIAAACLLPLLSLLYLYEVEVYQQQPLTVLALTFVAGAALGTGYALLSGAIVTTSLGETFTGALISGVALPVIAQLLMIAGPLVLLWRTDFDEALDGLSFGVCSALGFSLASVIAGYWPTLTASLQGSGAVAGDEILDLLRAGILAMVVNAAAAGLMTTTLWLEVRGHSRHRHLDRWRGLRTTLVAVPAAQVVLALAGYYMPSLVGVVLLWTAGAAGLLVWLRLVLHHALLEEGAELRIGAPSACSECHRLVPTMLFCPACGAARSAAPRRMRARLLEPAPDVD